jgi:uncharacterized protein (TIGR04141 family)
MLLSLNAFLIKPACPPTVALGDLTEYEQKYLYWDGQDWAPLDWRDPEIVGAAMPGDIAVVLLSRFRKPPKWQEFIRQELDLAEFGGGSTSFSTILFCAVRGLVEASCVQWLAWTFGPASRTVPRSASDPRFGLTIALNLLAVPAAAPPAQPSRRFERRPQVRELRYQTTAPYFQRTGHRAARDIPIDGFRLDRLSDLVSAIGGRIDVASFTNSVVGGRSLRFDNDIDDVQDLLDLSDVLVELGSAGTYQSAFPWIDNIRLVTQEPIVDKLYELLMSKLLDRPIPPTVDALLPDDLIDTFDERAIRFVLFPRERARLACRVNLTIDTIAELAGARRGQGSPRSVLDAPLRFLDDAKELVGKARLIECLCADLEYEGEQYLAYDGDFYRVERAFVQRIDNELAQLPHTNICFPPYNGETEPAYIECIKNRHIDEFVVLDRELIQLEGETGIEASDLVARSGALVHLKRKGKSSVLSHLFLQAANSCELLRRSETARDELGKLVEAMGRSRSLIDDIRRVHAQRLGGEGLEIIFGFLGDWTGRTILNLPLFSRISLVQESRRVAGLGYCPSVALISSRTVGGHQ